MAALRTMEPAVGHGFLLCFPLQVLWVNAPFVAFAAVVRCLVFRCRRRPVLDLAHQAVRPTVLSKVAEHPATVFVPAERPRDTGIALMPFKSDKKGISLSVSLAG